MDATDSYNQSSSLAVFVAGALRLLYVFTNNRASRLCWNAACVVSDGPWPTCLNVHIRFQLMMETWGSIATPHMTFGADPPLGLYPALTMNFAAFLPAVSEQESSMLARVLGSVLGEPPEGVQRDKHVQDEPEEGSSSDSQDSGSESGGEEAVAPAANDGRSDRRDAAPQAKVRPSSQPELRVAMPSSPGSACCRGVLFARERISEFGVDVCRFSKIPFRWKLCKIQGSKKKIPFLQICCFFSR